MGLIIIRLASRYESLVSVLRPWVLPKGQNVGFLPWAAGRLKNLGEGLSSTVSRLLLVALLAICGSCGVPYLQSESFPICLTCNLRLLRLPFTS